MRKELVARSYYLEKNDLSVLRQLRTVKISP
jgi:hypothetical protein